MKPGRASLTATIVALGRGIGTRRDAADPTAGQILRGPARTLVRLSRFPGARPGLRVASLGLIDHVTLRTLAVDAAIEDAVSAGIDQMVVLGAGLDGRAFRMPALETVDVLEVDHPATQAVKRRQVARLRPRARTIGYVAVDLETEGLDAALARSSHDARRPTLWIWEGVTPYLEPRAIASTSGVIGPRSAVGSRAIVTYATPAVVPDGLRPLAGLVKLGFSAIGEPLRGLMRPDEMARRLEAVGFEVLSDTDATDWCAYGPGSATLERPFRAERLVVARRTVGEPPPAQPREASSSQRTA